jgi:hypothetical protein
MPDIHKIDESSFLDHFDNNIMEYPRSLWRKLWSWKPFYWLRCHTFTKYHMIDCRNDYYDAGGGYTWGWHDRTEILLIANFNILAEFIELEHPNKFINWESDDDHSHAWSEMNDLYNWWKNGRRAERTALYAILNEIPYNDFEDMFEPAPDESGGEKYWRMKPFSNQQQDMYDRYHKEETRLEQKDQDNLHRLIEIRGYMWT